MPFPFLRLDQHGALKALTTIPGWAWGEGNENVDPVTAYNASAWLMRAVQIRAEAVPTAPLVLLDDDGEQIEKHPLLDLLQSVNAEWNYSDLWKYTEGGLCIWGAGYWLKVRAGGGRPLQLRYLNPGGVKVLADKTGILGFERPNTSEQKYAREDVVYFRGQYDPQADLTGLALAKWGAKAAIAELNSEKYLAAFFENFAMPAVILSTDQQLGDVEAQRVSSWWNRLFRGVANQFKTALLWSGLKATMLGYPLKDLDLSTVRAGLHQTISTALGVPELLISPTDAADLTPVKMAQRILYELTILPRWSWYAEVLNAELVSEYPDLVSRGAKLEFNYSQIPAMQEDADAKSARVIAAKNAGIITVEAAARELGYSNDDIPDEPEPAPTEAQEVKAAPPVVYQPPQPGHTIPLDSVEFYATRHSSPEDLTDYRSECVTAIKAGQPFPIAPPGIEASLIYLHIGDCKTASDVRRLFAAHRPEPEEPTVAQVLSELRRAREALTA